MKSGQRKLKTDMMMLTTVPLLVLGMIVLIITSAVIYRGLRKEVRSSLEVMVNALCQQYELLYPGDYEVRDGRLYKGQECISGKEEMMDTIKQKYGMDVTLFYGNKRYLTTLRNADGTYAAGTYAADSVRKRVLEQGETFFSDNVEANGISYFAYYIPLYHSDGSRVGMLFAGESRETVMGEVTRNVMLVCIAECIITLLVVAVTSYYSQKAVYALELTEKFLGEIAGGDLTAQIDPYLLERKDEIGEMGRFSVMLQRSITGLVGKDPLTGLPNRRSCDIVLDSLMKKAVQKEAVFSIAMGDIDFFKKVNDTYGHQAGDEVLKKISHFIAEQMEHIGFVFRWGGEEFLMVYEDMDRKMAGQYLESLQKTIVGEGVLWNGKNIVITMTFGIADSLQEKGIDEMIQHADTNLYIGKANGRNCIIGL